eukprot:scaffold5447_cov69-Phaeocystis_antarctica.AAC.1
MTEREFEEFWQTVDSRHRGVSPAKQLRRRAEEQARAQEAEPTLEDDVQSTAASSSTAAARSAKTARCGSCEACRAKDCGRAWVAPFTGPTALGCHIAWAGRIDTRLASSASSHVCFCACVRAQARTASTSQ